MASSRSTLLVVSHDRYLLDKVTNRTFELFRGEVEIYKGNYSSYWRQKEERVATERRTFDRQQVEIVRLEEFIRRNRYGQKHAQAEDRQRKLERIDLVCPPREIEAPAMGFPPAKRAGDVVLRVDQLLKEYDAPLSTRLTFTI